MSTDQELIDKWYARAEKKGPYHLLRREAGYIWRLTDFPEDERYHLIWQEVVGGVMKTKLGVAVDGMSLRYGFDVRAVLAGNSLAGLWQCSPNSILETELQALLDVANGRNTLPEFNIRIIKNVSW